MDSSHVLNVRKNNPAELEKHCMNVVESFDVTLAVFSNTVHGL